MSAALLSVEGLCAGYGDIAVLHDVSFKARAGEIAAIVGANGAGKTTLLSAISGLLPVSGGRIVFDGKDITGARAHQLPAHGLTLVPEGGRLFPFMTVRENLELGSYPPQSRKYTAEGIERASRIFPILRDRQDQLAGRLSGGERQMCALARALMGRPKLLMLDEPSVGLSPLMTERLLETVADLARQDGFTVIIVEQRVTEVLEMADTAHILDHGRIVKSAAATVMRSDTHVQEAYMGL
jgi:branched-chain amino acid transport system ATP-binding protein